MSSPSAPSPFAPLVLGGVTLRNRVIKAATYEGMTPRGEPSRALVDFHRDVARGGAAMTTVAYCAVSPDGRTFRDQLHMRRAIVPGLRALTDAVHAEGAAASLQLGHCGGFCNNADLERRPSGPSRGFNALGALSGRPWIDPMSRDDIARVTAEFVTAARRATEAGFDAVELHLGHGYLLSQFLSPATNRRRDEYGGSFAGRSRFPVEVARRVRDALPANVAVLVKTNLRDGFEGGLEVEDATEVVRALEGVGVDAVVLSGGFVSRDAMYLFRGARPLRQMIAVEKHWPQKVALAVFGPAVVRAYPFEPLFFLPLARVVRQAVRVPLVLLGGVTSRADLDVAMREGFELVGMARALVHDPALVDRLARADAEKSGCVPCNRCVAEMDRAGGVVCARQPAQIDARRDRVSRGLHLAAPSITAQASNARAAALRDPAHAGRWKGKVVVITGAGSGIGRALALAWAGRGAELVLADVSAPGLAGTRAEIVAAHGDGVGVDEHVVDVSDRARMSAFASAVRAAHGSVDVLVNNAGVAVVGRFEVSSLEEIDRALAIDLMGVVHGCHFFLPLLRSPGGHVVNMSSMMGFAGAPTQSAYCMAKGGVRALTESLRAELAPRGLGVTCVFPGTVKTPLVRNLPTPRLVRALLERLDGVGIPAARVAERVVRGVERHEARVVVGADAHLLEGMTRLSPSAFPALGGAAMRVARWFM